MKIMTIIGTRPEIIRLDVIMKKLDKILGNDHITVWTGQNYDKNLKDIFLQEFGTREFSYNFDASGCFHFQLSEMIKNIGIAIMEEELRDKKIDKILILGDTNSSLAAAIVGERMGVPVYHMEAGNRCYDPKVPEEKNRMVIDRISSFNMPYVQNSKENLLREGYPKERIFVTGNPIREVIHENYDDIESSNILERLSLETGKYILVTAHRAENVDDKNRFANLINAINNISDKHLPIIFSVHPRTKSRVHEFNYIMGKNIKFCEPFGFLDFVQLERNASCIITDSGTVQEEAAIFHRPCVVIRDSTERPETVECGSAIVSGLKYENIIKCYEIITNQFVIEKVPEGYDDIRVSDRVINFLMGNQL